jgi:hypothetical protein
VLALEPPGALAAGDFFERDGPRRRHDTKRLPRHTGSAGRQRYTAMRLNGSLRADASPGPGQLSEARTQRPRHRHPPRRPQCTTSPGHRGAEAAVDGATAASQEPYTEDVVFSDHDELVRHWLRIRPDALAHQNRAASGRLLQSQFAILRIVCGQRIGCSAT